MSGNYKVTFSISTIECISCTPLFKRELRRIPGVISVTPFVMMNLIEVEIDSKIITIEEVKRHVLKIAENAGFSGKVVFSRY